MSSPFITDKFVSAMDHKKGGSELTHISQQEGEFYVRARRNKLLANWAAWMLGLDHDHIPSYLMDIIEVDLKDGYENQEVIKKITGDFAKVHVNISEAELREKLDKLEMQARLELTTDHPLSKIPRET